MPTTATRARRASPRNAAIRRTDPDAKASPPLAPRLSLTVQSTVDEPALPDRATLMRIAKAALERDAAVTLRIVDGREGRALNRRFRGRNYATNVLTFV